MSEKETRTMFICGHEMDAGIAMHIFEVVRNSVPRVVEAMAINGCKDEHIKAMAITTAEAVVGAFVAVVEAKTNPSDSESARPPAGLSAPQPEAP
ncbi:TPA: hypothetical protein QCI16_004461 [Enterobacter ludwigii]|nr:hypothetical protein [Enterobacter ludwigii]HDR2600239.1 hypothetical protein [Enterobacter ludwigii]